MAYNHLKIDDMKNLNRIYFICSALLIGLLTSCEQDNFNVIYDEPSGVTFTNSALTAVTVQPNEPTFEVDILRADGSGTLSGSVDVEAFIPATSEDEDDIPFEGITVTGFSFAEGETRTTITVNAEPLEIGVVIRVELSLPEDGLSLDGVGATTVTVNKDYNWEPIGTGKFIDNWASGVEYEVEFVKAEGFDRWRALKPYDETLDNDDGDWGDWIGTSTPPYVEFWTVDNDLVRFASYYLGVNYEADMDQPIYAHHPSRFVGQPLEFNKWLDDKTVQLAPFYYIEDLGGWNNTAVNGVVIITLPD